MARHFKLKNLNYIDMKQVKLYPRVDEDVLKKSEFVLREIGLTPLDAIRILFHKIARDGAFPVVLLEASTEEHKIKSIDDLV